uniref:Translation initiation factor eIF2B subunit delta n=1 Tax=Kalanchoe fedtschenkoi TaxID=63787 RepID=A0A7N0SZU2_KALFE
MEARRNPRSVIDPKVRQVGFFAPPDRTQSGPPDPSSPPLSTVSPSGNSLSPVMIPPPRHASDSFPAAAARPAPASLRRPSFGSYNASDFYPPTPPATAAGVGNDKSGVGNGAEDVALSSSSPRWSRRGENSKAVASSFPGGGFDLTAAPKPVTVAASPLTTVSVVNVPIPPHAEKSGTVEMQKERPMNSKPLKEKTSKAERHAIQESQRAAKASKAEASKAGASGVGNTGSAKPSKSAKSPSRPKENASVTPPEKAGADRAAEKDRKKDVPQPRMQFDDKSRVQKAKRRAVVKQTEAKNIVELFRHLPQYEHGTQLPDLESRFFQLDPMHPAVYKVALLYLAGDISGGNARCIAMLQAFQEAIKDYSTPPEKTLSRDLTAKLNSYVSFLIEFRPLSISMGNTIRFLKNRIAKLPLTLSESEAKTTLQSEISRFISEKIILADKVIVKHAVTKIRDGDVLLTFGSSSAVEMIIVHAHELGRQFRVVIVDSRPKLEGQSLLRRLVGKGIACTYTHVNAVSYVLHEVTRVFLGASSILSNGTVYSRVGTACVAMVAHAFRVPVIVCCEAYKFHERVQLDSICFNELGDPNVILKVCGRKDINYLKDLSSYENMQLLNLIYDATPADYISMIITDYGMVCISVLHQYISFVLHFYLFIVFVNSIVILCVFLSFPVKWSCDTR